MRGLENRTGRAGGRGRAREETSARSPLHCVTKRATRPTKSLSTLMRVPRCVKIPRRRNNIGRSRCFAIRPPPPSPPSAPIRGRIVVRFFYFPFFIYHRYFPLFPTGYSSALPWSAFLCATRAIHRDWSRECDRFWRGLKRQVLPLR